MPLDPDQDYRNRLSECPPDSKPQQPPLPLGTILTAGGTIAARTGSDGTKWCAYCDMTLPAEGRRTQCPTCERAREANRARVQRAGDPFIQIPTSVLVELDRRIKKLHTALGEASSAYNAGYPSATILDSVMLAAKDVTAHVSSNLTQHVRPPAQPRHQARPPRPV